MDKGAVRPANNSRMVRGERKPHSPLPGICATSAKDAASASGERPMRSRDLKEKLVHYILTGMAASSLLALAGIVIFLFMEGLPLFAHYSPIDFLFGDLWYPTEEPGLFGIFPLLVASLAVTFFSSLLAVPLGVLTAVYLTEIAHPGVRRIIKPFVELLAALPSVVLGFLGMVVLAPFLQDYLNAATGLNLLNASLVLAFMSVPTICSVSEDALYSVPRDLREASLALGATRWQTTVRVVIPAALSGIGTAVMLGLITNAERGIWELADPCVSVANTPGLEGTPNEIKLKYLADNDFADLSGDALRQAVEQRIREKKDDLVGDMASQGTTPRRITDLIGSLCDLTSGSGDKGTPVVLVQGYFDNLTD